MYGIGILGNEELLIYAGATCLAGIKSISISHDNGMGQYAAVGHQGFAYARQGHMATHATLAFSHISSGGFPLSITGQPINLCIINRNRGTESAILMESGVVSSARIEYGVAAIPNGTIELDFYGVVGQLRAGTAAYTNYASIIGGLQATSPPNYNFAHVGAGAFTVSPLDSIFDTSIVESVSLSYRFQPVVRYRIGQIDMPYHLSVSPNYDTDISVLIPERENMTWDSRFISTIVDNAGISIEIKDLSNQSTIQTYNFQPATLLSIEKTNAHGEFPKVRLNFKA